jgi:ABC-type glycerol-3-phosphate transport system permease component
MSRLQRLVSTAFISVVSLAFLFPIFWMFVTAVRPRRELFMRTLQLFPSLYEWHNIANAWHTYPLGAWLTNSVLLSTIGTALTVVLDLMAGYAFAKLRFPGRNLLFFIFLGTLMLPTQVFLVPQFLMVASVHGLNHLWAVILPRAAETYGIFLARQFLQSIPDELIEAARLDGASEWTIFWRIVLPLSKPAIAVLTLLSFLGYWNDFAWPLVVLKGKEALTLPVGLSMPQGEHVIDWSGVMTIALTSILPVTLLFIALQRWFIAGISRTGVK